LVKTLLFSFDAITLAFFIEGETKQPIQRTLSGLDDSKEITKISNKPELQQANNKDQTFIKI